MPAPARGERTGLGLAVAHDARDHQAGVVERRAEGVHERVAELAALVDRPGVSGAACDGMPPGNENCRKSRSMPSRSSVMAGNSSEYVPSSHVLATIAGPP